MNRDALPDLMRERLDALAPEGVEIVDESEQHAGHEGAKAGGGHYWLVIVSPQFRDRSTVERHRMVYERLSDLMGARIHALSIRAYTPEEV